MLPSSFINGVRKINPNSIIIIPDTAARKKPVEEYFLALSISFAPKCLLMQLPEPWPNINPNACRIAIRLKTIPVAPLADIFIFETK